MKRVYKTLMMMSLLLVSVQLKAQITQVYGTVSDDWGPLFGVNVCEMDGTDRIVESATTDMNGNFTMRVKNPKNKIRFTYVGCTTVLLPIDRTQYDIFMKSENEITEVVVTSDRRINSGGLAIPEREISFASQTISTEGFEGLGINTIDEALQGRISGLDIVSVSGNLGAGTTMRLRGASTVSTLTSSNPLIVVNGNTWNVDMSNFDIQSANDEQFAQLLNINPEDIAEITVLKDAAATAIYGSQGANGVIELTTKRGKQGKPMLAYSMRMTGTYQPEGYQLLDGDDYTMLLKESYFNPQQSDAASDIVELNYDKNFSEYEQYNNNTDWAKAVKQVGLRQNHHISVSGGGEKANFRISGGFDNETGSVIKQHLGRFSTRVALDYFVSQRIQISTNFSLTYTKNEKNYDNLLSLAYKKMPNMGIYEQDPNTGEDTDRYYTMLQSASSEFDKNQKEYVNPVASANLAINNQKTYDIMPELQLKYRLLGLDDQSWQLTWDGRFYMNLFNDYVDQFYPSELKTVSWSNGINTAYAASSKSVALNTKQTLTLIPHFNNPAHSLMAMGRMEMTSGQSNGQTSSSHGLPSGGITTPSAGSVITGMSTSYGHWRSMYYTFSTHYAYKSKYMFDFSLRMDGSTKFGPGNRWGVFPAVSLRWNVIDEDWMEPTKDWLSMLSIRPSWGRVGNAPGSDYLYESKYGVGGRYLDMSSMQPQNIRLSNLRWEKVSTYDVGMDVGLFKDKLSMTLDWYNSTTEDMLMSGVRIPSLTGYTKLDVKNVGSMRNTGWELNVDTRDLVKQGKFGFDFNMAFGNNYNEILEMDETVLESLNSDFNYGNREVLQRVQIGNPFGAIYGFRFKGIYQYNYETVAEMSAEERAEFLASGKTAPIARNAEGNVVFDEDGLPLQMMYNYSNDGTSLPYKFKGGDAMYEDINHDGNINALDIVYLGSSLPKLTGGFGFNMKYDRWKLNTQFTYRVGNKILNLARLDAEAMIGNNNQSKAVNHRWRKEGDETVIPRAMYGSGSNYNTLISDRFVEDGSFLRLNYMQLSYELNREWVKSLGLRGIRCYLSANNLFCLTTYKGVDPEVGYGGYGVASDGGQTPRAKSYTLGISVDF
ncbi:MAG: SusC/RagA family TonB-linked outer membrane protein [Bacteroidaceae bacterium]|nr:SusC/RagA family TonB-linked outer membrane protein [Bacteroidaceae bacterium]